MSTEEPDAVRPVAVWDLPTRIFHWALVGLIPFLWWTAENDHMAWHKLAGFAVAALLAFRIYWGFFGSETSRFAEFLRGPCAIWNYLRGRRVSVPGHNPLGGWSVVALLILTALETAFGLFAIDEDGVESGPFASTVSSDSAQLAAHWHALLFNGLLVLIGLHVAAILLYLFGGQNLVGAMITGRSRLAVQVPSPRFATLLTLLFGIALAGAAYVGLWWLDNH
jgi:cytochrome b